MIKCVMIFQDNLYLLELMCNYVRDSAYIIISQTFHFLILLPSGLAIGNPGQILYSLFLLLRVVKAQNISITAKQHAVNQQ